MEAVFAKLTLLILVILKIVSRKRLLKRKRGAKGSGTPKMPFIPIIIT